MDNYSEAERIYLESVKYSISGYFELGKMYLQDIEDTKKAIEYFGIAYEKGYKNAAFWLGKCYEKLEDKNMARMWYEKGAIAGDTESETYFGKILYIEGKREEAEKYYKKAIENSEDAVPIYNLMIIYYEKGKIEEIKKLNKKLNKKGVENIDEDMLLKIKYMLGNKKKQKIFEHLNKADNFILKKQYNEAEKEYLEAIKYDKKIKYYLGNLYEIYTKDMEKAIKIYKETVKMEEKRAFMSLGNIYLKQKNMEEAMKWVKEGARKNDSDSQCVIGRSLQLQGKMGEAYKYYLKAAKQKNIIGIERVIEYYYIKKDYEKEKEWIYKIFNEKGILYLNKIGKLILLNRLREIKELGY